MGAELGMGLLLLALLAALLPPPCSATLRTEPKTWWYGPAPIVTQPDRVQTPTPLEDPGLERALLTSSLHKITGTVSDPSDLFGGKSPMPFSPDRDGSAKEGLPAALNPMYHVSVPLVPGDPNKVYVKPAMHGYRRPPPDGALPAYEKDKRPYRDPPSKQMQHDSLAGTDALPLPQGNIPNKLHGEQFLYAGVVGGENSDLISTASTNSNYGILPNSYASFKGLAATLRRAARRKGASEAAPRMGESSTSGSTPGHLLRRRGRKGKPAR